MKVARYIGGGQIAIVDEAEPTCPTGGLLVQTIASGLCSGELMEWYMDKKIPHVLGHEVCGRVIESQDARYSVGSRVAPHHHAPCLKCDLCRRGQYVHCEQWRRTKLVPGGMAERFAVSAENLNDTLITDGIDPREAALIEPLACVFKSVRLGFNPDTVERIAVVGLGVMGLMHLLVLPTGVGYDTNPDRVDWARSLGLQAQSPDTKEKADLVIVCPGSQSALDFAIDLADYGATIVLFAPFNPSAEPKVPLNALYFNDIRIVTSYSCGPTDTIMAKEALENGLVRANQVVSDFIFVEHLPDAYQKMKRGEILKPMVLFS